MSSHHIVREKQEPALLILGLDNFSDELLGQLLEWSPTLIVTGDTAEKVHAFGIKIDALVDGEIVAEDMQLDVKHIPAGDETIVASALKYLVANNYPAVNIITDELLLTDYLPYASQINTVIFYNHQKIYPVTNGFSKWKPAREYIELLSPVMGLHTLGLEKIDDTHYKTMSDGFISLQFKEPFVFIAESIE